ncbi:MAG: sigma-70 family RNA polymerase sigma factor [Pseudomonadota bacterium]
MSTDGPFQRWYDKYYEPLVAYLHRRFGPGPPEPEDIVQRTFTRVYSEGLTDTIRDPKAFLWHMASNMAISGLRAEQSAQRRDDAFRHHNNLDIGCLLTPERVLEGENALSVVVDCLLAMPETRRRAFAAACFEGHTHADIAKRMGITRQAVSKHVSRATQAIFDALEEYR